VSPAPSIALPIKLDWNAAIIASRANSAAEVITSFLPQAIERYQALVADLKNVLETDVMQAREHLKTLLGQIKLLPSECGKFLQAELRHSTEGLIGLAFDGPLKARMVAGARANLGRTKIIIKKQKVKK